MQTTAAALELVLTSRYAYSLRASAPRNMQRHLYSLLHYLGLPFIMLRMLFRSRQAPAYRQRFEERLGHVPPPPPGKYLWIHAVSVGETLAAVPLVESLLTSHPALRIALTTTTPTGSDRVRELFGDRVYHCYAPYDLPHVVSRFLDTLRPIALIVMETELWPNTLHHCAQRGIPALLANARLSAKSAAGYSRVGSLTAKMLADLHTVAAQTQADGDRFLSLGLGEDSLHITGSIKWDVQLDDGLRQAASVLAQQWGRDLRPVLVAASTHGGEELQLLDAYDLLREHWPDMLLVLVPRHPERFAAVTELVRRRGLRYALRSEGDIAEDTQVIVGDTMGELFLMLGAANLAFVGGSLVRRGGHNVLEPAAWGVPVLSGPHYFNFLRATELLRDAGALRVVEDTEQLAAAVRALLENPEIYQQAATQCREVVEANRGALQRLLERVEELLED